MTLPDAVEDEAIETIVGWTSRCVDLLSTEASRIEQCRHIYEAIHSGERSLDEAASAALAGDPYVDRALRRVTQDHLASGYLPPALCRFVEEALFMEAPPPFPPGQHSFNHRNRDTAIRVLVEEAIKRWNVHETRNVTTERPSACSLVAAALVRVGIGITEGQVAKIVATK
jgi:hypothetical protein